MTTKVKKRERPYGRTGGGGTKYFVENASRLKMIEYSLDMEGAHIKRGFISRTYKSRGEKVF